MAESRIAIFGGSFNPPHLGHAFVTLWALAARPIDEVWWTPANQHAFGKSLAPFRLRAAWCHIATRHLAGARVCEIEGEMGGESRTIDTLERLEQLHPDTRFSLLVGADLVDQLPSWKRGAELVDRFPIHVVGRGDDAGAANELKIPDISSTGLRDAFRRGDRELPAQWMDRAVVAAIPDDVYSSA